MADEMHNGVPARARGRPRKHYRPRLIGMQPDVDAFLVSTSATTGMPINMLVNAIVRGYAIQRGKMPDMPPTPDPHSDVLMVPITPMYELSE